MRSGPRRNPAGVPSPRETILADFLGSDRQRHGRGDLRPKVSYARQQQLLDLVFLEGLLPSEQVRDQGNLSEVLDRFHLHISMFEGVGVGNHTMVGHKNGVIVGNEGL